MIELGIPDHLYHPIHRCRFLAPNNAADFDYTQPVACVIDVRGVFQFLAERATLAGARVMLGTAATAPVMEGGRVTGVRARSRTRKEIEIRSRILIDATGYRSSLLKQAGVDPGFQRFGVGAEYDLYAPNYDQREAILIVGSQVAPSGYAWFFPWGRHRVRAGVGIIHKDSEEHPDTYLDWLVEHGDRFGADLRGAQPIEYHFGLIPSDGMAERFVGEGIMGVGDAAGQPSALLGEGIRWAIKAGRMAGETAAESVRAGDHSARFLSRYEKAWTGKFGRDLRIAAEINRRIAKWDDAKWDARTELLKKFTPDQFAEALKTNLLGTWAFELLWKNPALLKHGLSQLVFKR